jgi:hypothetical protein
VCYAASIAIFMVGCTAILAALGTRHIIAASLIPDWILDFVVVFSGGLTAARSKNPALRIATLAISSGIAWALIEAGIAHLPYHPRSIINILHDIPVFRFAIAVMAAWGLPLGSVGK